MNSSTRHIIIEQAKKLFALHGYEGFSMRLLADKSGVGISSIYHFFEDKNVLLREIFNQTRTSLGLRRAQLPEKQTASEMLRQRIEFQFKNIEDVVFILKYYLHYRDDFAKNSDGYIPQKAYLHVQEALKVGISSGEFSIRASEMVNEAKTIAHAINGFLLEYYPATMTQEEQDVVIQNIHTFIVRSLTNKEAVMK